jgi:rhamnosyltransferase
MASCPDPQPVNTCAVVVTYHPDDGLPERVAKIAPQVSRVYIVDNGSTDAEREMLRRMAQSVPGVALELLGDNEGVGAALNRGFRSAIADGFAWVTTFDQDSVVETDLIAELAAIYLAHPERSRVKVVGPNYIDGTGDAGLRLRRGPARWKETFEAITSGAMIAVDGYQQVGPFREDYFIDSVDHEFCLRLRRGGNKIICSTRPLMHHPLGRARKYWVPWGKIVLSHHAPFRRYYITRNRILTMKAFALQEPWWTLGKLWSTTAEFLAIPVLERQRWAKLRAMSLGLWHGLIGRSGKLEGHF